MIVACQLKHHSSWLLTGQYLNHICWHWRTSISTSLIRHINFLKFSFWGSPEFSLGIHGRCTRGIFFTFTWVVFTSRRSFLFYASSYSQMLMMKSSTQSLIFMEMKKQVLTQGFLVICIPFFGAKCMWSRSGWLWEWFWWKGFGYFPIFTSYCFIHYCLYGEAEKNELIDGFLSYFSNFCELREEFTSISKNRLGRST